MSRPRSCASRMERRGGVGAPSGGMREGAGGRGSCDAEMLECQRRQVGDAPRRGVESDGEQGHLGVGAGKGAVTPTAEMAPAPKVVELDAFAGRDDQLARVRIAERRPRALERVGLRQERQVAARLPAAPGRGEAKLLAGPPRYGCPGFEAKRRVRTFPGV